MLRFPIGIDNFKELATQNYVFVDHTLMIQAFIESGDKLSLILRPRRWGKSLTLSMLYYFLAANEPNTENVFDGLKIATFDHGTFVQEHQGQSPVILLSLKDIKEPTYEGFLTSLSGVISDLYSAHRYLLNSKQLIDSDKEQFMLYLKSTAHTPNLSMALKRLSNLLNTHFNQPV